MNMKLSYRDKIIFIVAIVIIILVAGFFLCIKPKFEEIDSAKAAFEAKQQEQTELDTKIGTLPSIIENMKTVAQEVGEKQEIFFEEYDPYLNEDYVRAILNDLNINVNSMETAYTTADKIERYVTKNEHLLAYDNKMKADIYQELPQEVWDLYNKVPAALYGNSIIGVTTMDVKFESNVDLTEAWAFVNRLSEDEKTIIINTIESGDVTESAEEAEPVTEIEVNLTMYSIFPLNVDKVLEENADWQQYMNAVPADSDAA